MEIYTFAGQAILTLLKKDFDDFASKLAKLGVKRISGNLVGDDTWFDTIRLSPGIEKNDESYYYAAQISALTVSPEYGLRCQHGHCRRKTSCTRESSKSNTNSGNRRCSSCQSF